ncbi:hypothetical protein AMTRI_Chr10g2460 [Amborella trichopoda]
MLKICQKLIQIRLQVTGICQTLAPQLVLQTCNYAYTNPETKLLETRYCKKWVSRGILLMRHQSLLGVELQGGRSAHKFEGRHLWVELGHSHMGTWGRFEKEQSYYQFDLLNLH